MKRKKYIFFSSIIILVNILCSCVSIKEKQPVLNGMVYDLDNEPVSGVLIKGENVNVYTDIYGHFRIDEIKKNEIREIQISKKGYEERTFLIEYYDATQLIYLRLYSAEQLLCLSEKSISNNDYDTAIKLIERAILADCNILAANYLKAIIYSKKQEWKLALEILESQIADGELEPYIYLFIADIYQHNLNELDNAKKYLKLFLDTKYIPEIEARYLKLVK